MFAVWLALSYFISLKDETCMPLISFIQYIKYSACLYRMHAVITFSTHLLLKASCQDAVVRLMMDDKWLIDHISFQSKNMWLQNADMLCYALFCISVLTAVHDLYTNVWLIVLWLQSWVEAPLTCSFFTAGVELWLQMKHKKISGDLISLFSSVSNALKKQIHFKRHLIWSSFVSWMNSVAVVNFFWK